MKNLSKSNLFTTCLAMLVLFSIIGFVGCEKLGEVNPEQTLIENIIEDPSFVEYCQYWNTTNNLIKDLDSADYYRLRNVAREIKDIDEKDRDIAAMSVLEEVFNNNSSLNF